MKKFEYHENGQYFLSLISESETHILYRVTYRVKYYKPLFLDILNDYGLQTMLQTNVHKINKKRIF